MAEERPRRRVSDFLEVLATETNVNKSQARIKLAKKIEERSRLGNRKKQKKIFEASHLV